MGEQWTAGGGVPAGKAVAPRPPARWLARPRVDDLLDRATTRRLTLVTGSAGWGKTTALAAWADARGAAWCSLDTGDRALPALARGLLDALRLRVPGLPGDLLDAMVGALGPDAPAAEEDRARAGAGTLAAALLASLQGELVLVLDDVDELGPTGPAWAFVEALCRQAPRGLRLVLAGRAAPPFPVERLRGRGEVSEVAATDLALDAGEVASLVAAALDDEPALAAELHRLTAGWPAAVCLAVDALAGRSPAQRSAALAALRARSGPLIRYLVAEVLEAEPDEVRALLRAVEPLPAFDAELCEALGFADVDVLLARLSSAGVLLQPADPPGWLRLTELARGAVRGDGWGGAGPGDDGPGDADPPGRAAALRRAVDLLADRRDAAVALRICAETASCEAAARVLERAGSELVAGGHAALVDRACAALPQHLRSATVERVHGEALQVVGAWEDALACFRRVVGEDEQTPAALAWRLGLIHYARGELDEALSAFERARTGAGDSADEALLHAWWAAALWRKAEAKGCREHADAAHACARASGVDAALAAAHTALAMVAALEGDRRANDAHYLQALAAAERAGDVLQVIRIRTNRASHFLDEGFYEQAVAEAEIAAGLAGPAGFATFHALSLNNRGEAAMHLGRLEEAIADFRAALAIEQRIDARTAGYPLLGLADVARLRGDLAQARAAYREAIGLSEADDDVQLLVPALAGLALTLVEDDPQAAREAADRAVGYGPGMAFAHALLARGWVAAAAGDVEQALADAQAAEEVAAERRDRPAMADALELRAAADAESAVPALEEAVGLWTDIGNPVRRAQAQRRLARARGGARALVEAAESDAELRRLGVRAHLDGVGGAEVEISSFGGLRVAVGGRLLGPAAWQSRKARDLLKILVARRGRSITREALLDLLWPEEDADRTGNRLSVALSTVRGVLDPQRRRPSDWHIRGDKSAVALDLDHVWVDLEHFLEAAERGLDLLRAGDAEAATVLAGAESLYVGDFLEEDIYEDWAVAPREQARATYVAVARALAADAAAAGDSDRAVRLCLRVLERDAFDEPAHLQLVGVLTAAHRHGEARRHYRAYEARMAEIGVEAAPFPA